MIKWFFFRHEKKPSCFGDNESIACEKGLQPSSGCIQACKSSQCHRGVAVHPINDDRFFLYRVKKGAQGSCVVYH